MTQLFFLMLGLFSAGLLLAVAIVRLPLMMFDRLTWTFLIAGIAPYVFIRGDQARRYTGAVLAIGGAFGLLSLVREYAECWAGQPGCVQRDSSGVALGAVCYAGALLVGVVCLRSLPRRGKT